MKLMTTTITIITFVIFFNPGFAQNSNFTPEVKIGGLIFTGFTYNLDNADFINKVDTSSVNSNSAFGLNPVKNQFETGKNSFYLDRAYINVKASLTPQINARITPDIIQIVDGTGKNQYALQVKFAFVDYTPVKLDNGTALTFTAGIIPNTWISNMDKYWGYRGVSKTLTDYTFVTSAVRSGTSIKQTTGSYFPSADMGLTTKFSFPNKFGEINLSLVNGNGFKDESFDANRFKDFMASAFIFPFQGTIADKTKKMKDSGKGTRIDGISDFVIGGFAYMGRLGQGEYGVINGDRYASNRFGGMLNLKFNFNRFGFLKAGFEYSFQSNKVPSSAGDSSYNSQGYSGWLEFNPPVEELNDKLTVVFRYDSFDPNTSKPGLNFPALYADNGKQNMIIAGIYYKPANMLTFGLTYRTISYEKEFVVDYDGKTKKTLDRLFFNIILDF
jgi:hypothetical protein